MFIDLLSGFDRFVFPSEILFDVIADGESTAEEGRDDASDSAKAKTRFDSPGAFSVSLPT